MVYLYIYSIWYMGWQEGMVGLLYSVGIMLQLENQVLIL